MTEWEIGVSLWMTSYGGNGGGVKVGISGGIHHKIKTLLASLLPNFRKWTFGPAFCWMVVSIFRRGSILEGIAVEVNRLILVTELCGCGDLEINWRQFPNHWTILELQSFCSVFDRSIATKRLLLIVVLQYEVRNPYFYWFWSTFNLAWQTIESLSSIGSN